MLWNDPWIYNYLCNQCLSPLKLRVRFPLNTINQTEMIKWETRKKKIYQTFGTVTKWIRKIVVTDTKYGYSLHNRHDRPLFWLGIVISINIWGLSEFVNRPRPTLIVNKCGHSRVFHKWSRLIENNVKTRFAN
jgi:hypothetical protein